MDYKSTLQCIHTSAQPLPSINDQACGICCNGFFFLKNKSPSEATYTHAYNLAKEITIKYYSICRRQLIQRKIQSSHNRGIVYERAIIWSSAGLT